MSSAKLMTVNEVAKALSIDPRTVRRHAAAGHLAAVRVGKLWRFHRDVVREAREKGIAN
jgi:excisionase family DNA binding protein